MLYYDRELWIKTSMIIKKYTQVLTVYSRRIKYRVPERVDVSHKGRQMYGRDIAAVRIVQVGAARVQRVQALGRRAYVNGPAEQPVQLALVGRRLHAARIELVQLH